MSSTLKVLKSNIRPQMSGRQTSSASNSLNPWEVIWRVPCKIYPHFYRVQSGWLWRFLSLYKNFFMKNKDNDCFTSPRRKHAVILSDWTQKERAFSNFDRKSKESKTKRILEIQQGILEGHSSPFWSCQNVTFKSCM